MITLFGRKNSSNVQRAVWALEELGVAYERKTVGGSFGGTDTPDYRAMNPTGLVPALVDRTGGGDITLWESEAIIRHLAVQYGEGKIWPSDAAGQARVNQWLAWAGSTLVPAFGPVFYGTVRSPRAAQDFAALAPAVERLFEAVRFLDAGLARNGADDWLGGPAFSIADIPAGILMYRTKALPFDQPATPALDAWYARLTERPAFKAHVMLPMGSCAEEWLVHEKALHASESG